MTAAGRRVVLLLLLLGGVGVSAAAPDHCEAATRRLPTADLDKIAGHWISVWGVADGPAGQEVLDGVATLHVEWTVLPDRTVRFLERNLYKHDHSICITVNINATVEPESDLLTLHSTGTDMFLNDILRPYNETYQILFYQTCQDCLLAAFTTVEHGRFLMNYRKEGVHQDNSPPAERKAAEELMKRQAECLSFPTDRPYVYDGQTGFCHGPHDHHHHHHHHHDHDHR